MKYETNEEKECRHEQCPYGRENYKPMNGCFWDLMSDALALLKEQEAVEPIPPEKYGLYRCGNCYNQLFRCVDKYCSRCGKAVKWG